MKTRRHIFFVAAGIAALFTQAHANPAAEKVALVCPDRSPRMADIELAVKTAHWQVSQATYRQMLERTRSVCAAGMSVANLPVPVEPLAAKSELASTSRR